jgi:phosphonate transport system substrate-binding protein
MRKDYGIVKKQKRYLLSVAWNGSLIFILALLLLPCRFPHPAQASDKTSYIIAVVPQLPPVTMHTNWSPFVELLKKETGERFRIKVYNTMGDFEDDYKKGVGDFIYANPVQTVIAYRAQGYVPLVRSSRKIAGVLFVKKDSGIYSVRDLRGRDVAFVGARNV